jgi:hypothetical protein
VSETLQSHHGKGGERLGAVGIELPYFVFCKHQVILEVTVKEVPHTDVLLVFKILEHSWKHVPADNDVREEAIAVNCT